MNSATRQLVRLRAGGRCEYCLLRPNPASLAHQVEHIIAQQHRGTDDPANLALACDRCNAYKEPNLSGIDPDTGSLAPLYHPRRDEWSDHFELRGPYIVGRTAIGRVTVWVLAMNEKRRLERRADLLAIGEYP